jgi:hypothetical protein
MLLGPPWTATGDPGASVNNAGCAALEGASPERREIKNNVHDAASNKATQLIIAGVLIVEVTASSPFALVLKTLRNRSFFRQIDFS